MEEGYKGIHNIDPETGKEKVIEFGAKPWSIFGSSARVNISVLVDEGWSHWQEYPYNNPMWGDKTDFYRNSKFPGIQISSNDYHSSVMDMRKDLSECKYFSYPYHSFKTIEQMRVLLERLKEKYYDTSFRIWEEDEFKDKSK